MIVALGLFFMVVLLVGGAVILLTVAFAPHVDDKVTVWRVKKEQAVEKEMDNMFYYDKSPQYIVRFYFILPPVLGVLGYVFFHSAIAVVIGILLGVFIPTAILRIRNAKRRQKFNNQILDAIMILSSSLKGGLSLLQALEVLAAEMPAPMSQEIGLVIRENKLGISLEETLRRLDKRMGMEDLSLVINSVLVARETGGDLTKVFSRLTTTIRDNRKLKDSIRTLTLQGRMQGWIMSFLPIAFAIYVIKIKPDHFNIMLQTDLGRMLLIIAVVLQLVGMLLIRRFSIIKI